MTRKLLKIALVVLLSVVSISIDAQEKPVLWYDKPARYWEEALPLGNGRLGAMVYGTPATEQMDKKSTTSSTQTDSKIEMRSGGNPMMRLQTEMFFNAP